MLCFYLGALTAAVGWMMVISNLRRVQVFPSPTPIVPGPIVLMIAIMFSSLSCFFSLDRFYPSFWETICPCCRKGEKPKVSEKSDDEDEDDEGDVPSVGMSMGMPGMGYGGLDMFGFGGGVPGGG